MSCPVREGMLKLSYVPHKWCRDICVSFPKIFLSCHWVQHGLGNLGKKRLLITILVIGSYSQTHLDVEP